MNDQEKEQADLHARAYMGRMHDQTTRKQIAANEISDHLKAALTYADTAIKSSLLLNGGALFVLPAYIAAMSTSGQSVPATLMMTSAFFYLVGIIFGAGCAFLAYLNQFWFSQAKQYELDYDLINIEESYDVYPSPQKSSLRVKNRHFYDDKRKKLTNLVDQSFIPSIILGLGAYFFFAVGSYFAGLAMLAIEAPVAI